MGFRYDMQGKSPQQQAIVRKQDEAEKKKLEAAKQKKSDEFQSKLSYEIAPNKAAYHGILVKDKENNLFELRVTIATLFNEQSGISEVNIYEWLFETGKAFATEVREYQVLTISSVDVLNKKLVTNWKKLKREEEE